MTEYVPDPSAKWVALVRRGRVLMTATSTATDVADGYWEALGSAEPLAAVLGLITRGGIQDVPPFALVVPSGGEIQVIVRGGFRVQAAGDPVTGTRVSTWSEHVLDTVDGAFEIAAPFTRRTGAAWPLVEAVVHAGTVRVGDPVAIGSTADAAPSGTEAEAPAATIVPEQTLLPAADADGDADADAAADVDADAAADAASPVAEADDEVEDRTIVVVRDAASRPPTAADDEEDGTIALPAILRLREQRKTQAAARPPAPASDPGVHLTLPGSVREPLTGEIVLGRSPGVNRAAGGRLPRLVTIGAGDPDISRSHVKVGLQGGTIVVTDLDSRNGTVIIQPGRPPVRLRAGEDTPVLVGTLIDLGGGWTVKVEGD
ncbi:FHA domain-containing protein [Agromyces sp. LHK192]|uniref:FHA domain-containing protein n=1 Tax=Agromyces sp. LHK192 TaxID=2498704 RepID=UPI000FD71341|nr:FHA domain-containing protein [Agromyces sp. LHK192]